MMKLDQRMWGSNTILNFPFGGAYTTVQDTQLADVPFSEAVVASVFFQAEVISQPGVAVDVKALTLTLNAGLGRVTVVRQTSWAGVPATGAPFFVTLPFVPVTQLLATVGGIGRTTSPGSDPLQILCTLEVAPISRFPMNDPLKFGMAKPGEADGLDDGMYEELQDEQPEAADLMRHRQDNGGHPLVAGADEVDVDELDGDDDDESSPQNRPPLPPRLQAVAERLARRLGRPPKVKDLPPWARIQLTRHLRGNQ
jgi:hypothetical protein